MVNNYKVYLGNIPRFNPEAAPGTMHEVPIVGGPDTMKIARRDDGAWDLSIPPYCSALLRTPAPWAARFDVWDCIARGVPTGDVEAALAAMTGPRHV